MSARPTPEADRVLVIAPPGAGTLAVAPQLSEQGLTTAVCADPSAFESEIHRGCGTVVLSRAALESCRDRLAAALQAQPPWSDLPVVVVAEEAESSLTGVDGTGFLGLDCDARLASPALSGAAVRAALHTRQCQYRVRRLLEQRDEKIASLEHRLAEAETRADALAAELDAFSRAASHDLRAPLRSIAAYARILGDEFRDTLPEEGRHYAARIEGIAEKMDQLTRDLLTFDRIARSEVANQPVDLDEELDGLLETYPDLAAARRFVELRTPLGRVFAHGPSLAQCLSNLLQNAFKFIPGDRVPRVCVRTECHQGWVRLWVEDNGVGINPTDQGRVFRLFERASPAAITGTGAGLAIAKAAVERMGGTIGLHSSPGEGSRFWIDLPNAAPSAPLFSSRAASAIPGRWDAAAVGSAPLPPLTAPSLLAAQKDPDSSAGWAVAS